MANTRGIKVTPFHDYVQSKSWKCKKSPTNAHHWVEDGFMTGKFICKHCQGRKNFPTIYDNSNNSIGGKPNARSK